GADGSSALHPLLRRSALPPGGHGDRDAARAPRRHGLLPRGTNVLWTADGQLRLLRRRAAARGADDRDLRAVPADRLSVRQLRLDGAQPLSRAAARRAAAAGLRAGRVSPRRPERAAGRSVSPSGRAAPELSRAARAPARQRQRAAGPGVRQDEEGARADRGPRARRSLPPRRVLRIRRHLRGHRGGRLLRDGARPDRGSRARRRGGDRRRRHVVSDAPRGADPARRREAAHHAPRGTARPGDRMNHAKRSLQLVQDTGRMHWHDQAVWFVRQKRDAARNVVPEWEELRSLGSQIKAHVLSRLPEYLEQFEKQATAAGAVVHWARDAREHNQIVFSLLSERRVTRLVKSKSMLTEECGMNEYLEERGVEVVDTDLGERIVQFRHEPPSHIVAPAIHLKRQEIGALFHEKLGTPADLSDPAKLAEAARHHLRAKFLAAQAGLTGVNFAIASTGGVVVCTNEG